MPFSLNPHEHKKIPGTNNSALVEKGHYLRVSENGEPPLYIQKGRVYSEGGQLIAEPPGWFKMALTRFSDDALATVGYERPKKAAVEAEKTISDKPRAKKAAKKRRGRKPKAATNSTEVNDGDDHPGGDVDQEESPQGDME